MWWHEAPCTHWHLSSQLAPNRPGSHAEQGRCKLEYNIASPTVSTVQQFPWGHSFCRFISFLQSCGNWLTFLTALSDPAGAAAAPSGLPVTLAAGLTFTLLLAIRPEPARYTLCVNIQQCAQAGTHTSDKTREGKQKHQCCEPHATGKPVLSYFCWGPQHVDFSVIYSWTQYRVGNEG